ncbi:MULTISPECIES: integrase domain-containing protein [unclassified Massilia]|uniref:integrase domain-containing protein n=1 Tax=unclassified Massilia TaxID=2609279 RepID=UPI00178586FA|nr:MULTISPECIES: integrase domain-containing protein [unclassified Massilia]MBD8531685.1 integrase domain-containing protein [Massilia sp. CFBP 13647]MBD8675130.1 integrase domain-containing protein [Massilia sp. CFBP 13721]
MESLRSQINAYLKRNAGTRTDGSVAGERTKSAIGEHVHANFNHLLNLGFKLQRPENFGERHIVALCRFWYENNYAASTIRSNLSYMRIFCRWMGKGNMVKSAQHYLPEVPKEELKVKTVAAKSKSWAVNGVDVIAKINEADAIDPRFGMMLRMCLAFGLRAHEVIELCPWKHDRTDRLSPEKTKTGRARDIFIDTPEQRVVLNYAKSMVKKNEHLGWKTRQDNGGAASLEYNKSRWYRLLGKVGITKEDSLVTGHGLRSQYAENAALLLSVIPPTLGGTGGQMGKEDLDLKRAQVSESLGHSRIFVTGPYLGSFGRNNKPDSPDRTKLAVEAAIRAIAPMLLKDVLPERMNDCGQLTIELMMAGASAEPRVTQMLWENHSRRHGVEWLTLGSHNVAAMEAAAKNLSGAM